ncbi:MAG: ATP-binding protein [Thiobacillus sp.]
MIDSQSELFCLKRLILIDSYRKGAKVEIKLDGHTSLNGTNAAGKTSLLRLIPLFYGESPHKMVRGGGVTQSFISHYLPHSTSSIIFEYNRRSQICMAVMHASKSGESVYYRFVDQPFDISRFVDENGELVDGSDLNRHITKRNEYCSDQITALADYRAIIQNTVRKKEHRGLAGRFAFVGAGSRLAHIEKIVTGMFSREISFHDIKRVIASCIMEDNQSIRLVSNKSEMESWLKEYRAYQAVMSHASRMKVLGESALRHEEASRQLRGVHTEFLLLLRQHEQGIQAASALLGDIDTQMRLLEDKTNKMLRETNTAMGLVNGRVESIAGQIDGLERRRDQYALEKIKDLGSLVDQIPEMETSASAMKKRETALLGESGDLAARYAGLKNDRTTRFHDLERDQNALKDPIRAKAEAERERLTLQSTTEWAGIEAAYEKQEQTLQDEKSAINENLGGLRVAAGSPQPSPKYVEARDTAQTALNEAMEAHTQALQAYEAAEQDHAQENLEFDSIDGSIQKLHTQVAQEGAERDRLLSLANAAPGTLLHFLRENRSEWANDIARVVPEELLLREDLDPSITKGEDLYGVSLDLSAIDAPRAADEEILRGQIEEIDRAISRIRDEIKTHETELVTQSERLTTAKDKAAILNQLRIQAEGHKSTCRTALDTARRELEADRKEAARNAQRDLAEQQEALAKKNKALTLLKTGRTEKKQAHDTLLARALKAITETRTEVISQIDATIQQARTEYQADLCGLDNELVQTLKAAGVDTATLALLRGDMSKLDSRLIEARNGIAKVGGWRNWVKDEWIRYDELKLDLSGAQTEAKRLADDEIRVKGGRDAQNKVLKARLDATKDQKVELERMQSFAKSRCGQLGEWSADMAEVEIRPGPSKSQDGLEAEMDRALQEIKAEKGKARQEVDVLRRAMYEHPNTTPYAFYEHKRLALGPDQEQGSPFIWVRPMQEWFDTAHVDARRVLLNQCSLFSQGIHHFHDRLNKFKRHVTTFSNDLGTKMNDSIQFRSINGIAVRLTTSFDSIEVWDKIRKMDEEYSAWAGSNDLPPETFAAAVTAVNNGLQGRHSVEVKPEDLIEIELDIDEAGQPIKTVKDEVQLKSVSSNGLSYIIMCVVFVGLINKIRGSEPVVLAWSLDELRDLDSGNVQLLLELLTRNKINLVSAFPDPDPEILSMFKHRYTIQEGRKVATFRMPGESAHV